MSERKYQWEWDYEAAQGYLHLNPRNRPVHRTVELEPGVQIDLDNAGNVIGVEILQ